MLAAGMRVLPAIWGAGRAIAFAAALNDLASLSEDHLSIERRHSLFVVPPRVTMDYMITRARPHTRA